MFERHPSNQCKHFTKKTKTKNKKQTTTKTHKQHHQHPHENPNKSKKKFKDTQKPPNKKLQQLCNKEDLDEVEIPYSKLHAVSLHSKVFHWKEATVLINWVASNQKANITASSKWTSTSHVLSVVLYLLLYFTFSKTQFLSENLENSTRHSGLFFPTSCEDSNKAGIGMVS